MVNSKTIAVYDHCKLTKWIEVCDKNDIKCSIKWIDDYYLVGLTCTDETFERLKLEVERLKYSYN